MQLDIAPYLDILLKENIDVVLHVFIRTLAIWMEEYVQASGGQLKKDTLISDYDAYVGCTIADGNYKRIDAPDMVTPPMSWAKVDELTAILTHALRSLPVEEALPFLGELTGAWILSYPASLIQQENVRINKKPKLLTTEADLTQIMWQWFMWALR